MRRSWWIAVAAANALYRRRRRQPVVRLPQVEEQPETTEDQTHETPAAAPTETPEDVTLEAPAAAQPMPETRAVSNDMQLLAQGQPMEGQVNDDVSSTTALAQDKTDQPPLETNKTARRPVAGGVARKYISHAWRHHHVALETTRACRHAMEIPLQAMDIEHEDDQAEGVNDRLDLDASRARSNESLAVEIPIDTPSVLPSKRAVSTLHEGCDQSPRSTHIESR
ncbi:hypothetical protein Ae201684_000488 [Aphanomyces euteiches]|uniref:Uncharacterized protein n=1 Tax=Aphanomyces euteiches TaxID=100861 RepID=A0A6G0XXZ9_9STRA|nr:hypothetical protein Ae201684_000488 [Aphanomyces euteiches]